MQCSWPLRASSAQTATGACVTTRGWRTWPCLVPLIFCTPNLADTKLLILLIVQGEKVALDSDDIDPDTLPTDHQMMQRLARDPVGQTSSLS